MTSAMHKDLLSLKDLALNKKVIPIYYQNGDLWHTDIKLLDLVLINKSQAPLEIDQVVIKGFADGRERVRFLVDQETVYEKTQSIHQVLNRQRQSSSIWAAYNLGMLFGKLTPLAYDFMDFPLPPESAACLRLQELVWFHYAGNSKIDQVLCEVALTSGEEHPVLSHKIPITPYTCKGDYIFPVKGRAIVTGMPINHVLGHRIATSQEFAFDVVDFRPNQTGGYYPSDPPESPQVKDYAFFEREVLAVGDGIVAASGSQWPNRFGENPMINPDDRIIAQTQTLLDGGMDFTHAILGNYAIIDHQNGEFSVYAHMSEDTVTVKPGEAVRQGQVIGKVGNTSNSDFPHLHFHLMDSDDFLTANGLPVKFVNLPNGQPPCWDHDKGNSLLYSDYIFLNIPA